MPAGRARAASAAERGPNVRFVGRCVIDLTVGMEALAMLSDRRANGSDNPSARESLRDVVPRHRSAHLTLGRAWSAAATFWPKPSWTNSEPLACNAPPRHPLKSTSPDYHCHQLRV